MKKNSNSNANTDHIASNKNLSISFPIIGIGASAGGLEALEQFFNNMPDDAGMAFVVIQHLDPHHKGIMPELLQRMTQMKVFQATDRLKVKPDCVYVIPPNKSLSLLNGSLHLFDMVESRGLRLPVDIFFRSMAQDRGEKSIGIILSGMGSDGSLGMKDIKEKNGLVLVQDPESAKFDGMPRSTIDAVIADVVASANELPEKLISLLKYNQNIKPKAKLEFKVKSNLDKIIILLREQTGHDFSLYKKTSLLRRIERRKSVHEIDHIKNYVRFLQENPKETEILFKELLIGVTSFFRDPDLWENLRDHILPDILKDVKNGSVLRAWVPGCSTGEEAYTLAIIFKEAMEKVKKIKNVSLQIFATDLDIEAIEKARKGYFTKSITSDVSPERIAQFFTPEGEGFRINNNIREMILFATHNVIKDPPFTKLDLLSCRNMLIYMESELQNKLLGLFHYSLNNDGIMLLGSAETLGAQTDKFSELNLKLKIFKSRPILSTPELIDFPSAFRPSKTENDTKEIAVKVTDNIQSVADQILLQRYAPASVLINSKGDIIYITGRTGKYLEPVAGKANWNIYAMAREGLNHELPGAIRKATQNSEPVLLRNLKIEAIEGTKFVDVTIQRIDQPETLKGLIIIVFTDVPPDRVPGAVDAKTQKRFTGARRNELELELKRAVEDNQSIREQMQTSQEELQSTNEELQSTNEELQSTNEELTTSKEEMQSMNEELQTVNAELQSKIGDFINANDDMENLLNSTEIAALFLDKQLNIRRFTDPVTHIFKIRNADINRPFTDLVSSLKYEEIDSDAQKVIKNLIPIEKSVRTTDGFWFNIRIMPYRTTDDRIDGLVMTFTNTTKSKQLEIALRETGAMLRLFIQKVQFLIIGLSFDGKIIEFNPVAEKVFGYKRKNILGKSYVDIFIPEALRKDVASEFQRLWKDDSHSNFVNLVKSSRGEQLKIEWTVLKLFDEEGQQTGIITIGEDITKQADSI